MERVIVGLLYAGILDYIPLAAPDEAIDDGGFLRRTVRLREDGGDICSCCDCRNDGPAFRRLYGDE